MNAKKDSLKWGIIGLGRFGRVHAAAVKSVPGAELVAISNRNPEKLQAAQKELAQCRPYHDYQQLLADPAIDVVSIVTHWRQHCEVAVAALEAGKHVFLEKPMAADREECGQIIAAADRSAGTLMVGHICRFDPRVTLAKQAIDQGRIGRIVSMHAKRNLPLAPGHIRLDKISPLMGDGVHDIDLMMWLTRSIPTRVYGRYVKFGEYRYPEIGWALLEFGTECLGVIETNWGLPVNVSTVIDAKLEVVGTAGKLTIDCSETGLMVVDREGPHAIDTVYWPQQHHQLVGALRNELEYFVSCIQSDTTPEVVTLADASRAVAVVLAAEQSAVTGNPVAFSESP